VVSLTHGVLPFEGLIDVPLLADRVRWQTLISLLSGPSTVNETSLRFIVQFNLKLTLMRTLFNKF